MLAMVMRAFGGEEVLEIDEVADPSPGPGEVLIKVGAVEVSSTRDVATRTGRHPFSRQVSLPHVLGGDFAGIVQEAGPGVDPGLVGVRVAASNSRTCGVCMACRGGNQAQCPDLSMLGIHRWGSYAELATVPAVNLNRIPDAVSFPEAAAMAATGPIALTQLRTGEIHEGTWLLVTGVTGSLGTTVAAMATQMGARVIGLSRRPSAIPPEIKLEAALDTSATELGEQLLSLTSETGVQTAIDNVASAEVFGRYFPALAIGARVVVSGAIGVGGLTVLPVPAGLLYLRSQSLLGVRTTTLADINCFWAMVHDGLRLPDGLVSELPLHRAADAHAQITGGARVGHTVLSHGI